MPPTDDCESFAWAVKKSVSSSTFRSGDVEDDDSEGASLENRAGCRGMRFQRVSDRLKRSVCGISHKLMGTCGMDFVSIRPWRRKDLARVGATLVQDRSYGR